MRKVRLINFIMSDLRNIKRCVKPLKIDDLLLLPLLKISYFTCFSHLILTLYTFYVSQTFVWFSLHHLECISVSLMYFYQFHVR